ncbi:MAG: hypothetical protein ABSC94_30435 [Polyangiaceae bacterium]
MRFGASARWVGVGVCVLAVAGTAVAQPASSQGSGQVGFERRVQLSPQEELAGAGAILTRMDQAAATVRRQLDSARQGRDVVKSLCLSDKLSQVDVAIRSAKDRQSALQAAVDRGDTELANHEFTIISVVKQRVDQLSSEANQCIGEEVAFVGQTQIITEIDPNLPGSEEGDTELPALPPPSILGPPQTASPYSP